MPDLFGEEIETIRNPDAYAAFPGTGPEGFTCKQCKHYTRVNSRTKKVYLKCGLIISTNGAGTDIKASSPACGRYLKRDVGVRAITKIGRGGGNRTV